ncbi:MAG: NAD(P)/FAD-dependent oxidoreductase [Verrucomicrobiaceae bacterium]|nr:MAG: NAD(P)/FAD-dependent oxidoreductase [Verrucomicrobiaceae bacterium]
MNGHVWDAVIIGGGPAGLSSALLLGRCLRRVLVCDAGSPRNAASRAMHGFIGHDGIDPAEFLRKARRELERYQTVKRWMATVKEVRREDSLFVITLEDQRTVVSHAVLLATGARDRLPALEGAERFYGRSLHHCPYCDAFEHRGRFLGVLGNDQAAADLAVELRLWSRKVVLFTNAVPPVEKAVAECMGRSGVRIVEGDVTRLEGCGDSLERLCVGGDSWHVCEALFFSPRQMHQSGLAAGLGCPVSPEDGAVSCSANGTTEIEGLFVAGNLSNGVQMAVVAAAEGVKAGAALNDWLLARQCELSTVG